MNATIDATTQDLCESQTVDICECDQPYVDALVSPVIIPFTAIEPDEPPKRDESQSVLSSEEFTLDGLERMLDAHPAGLSKSVARWLVRICRASDVLVEEMERALKAKETDYTGLCLEYQDLLDENRRLKQDAEIGKVVMEARANTIMGMQKRVKELEDSQH